MVSRVTGRLAVLLAALWLAVPVPHGLVAAPDPISRAEAWFDDISTMKADFIQVASDGTTATGELHLRRPHRMKIIYDLDEPLILLTTPVWLHVDRPKEKTVTSYPINETPLSLILREDVELRSSDFTTRHLVRDGITRITLTRRPAARPANSSSNSPTSPSSCAAGPSVTPLT